MLHEPDHQAGHDELSESLWTGFYVDQLHQAIQLHQTIQLQFISADRQARIQFIDSVQRPGEHSALIEKRLQLSRFDERLKNQNS